MQLADSKNCWLSDLDNVPLEELHLWMAYHDLENRRLDRLRRQEANKAKSAVGR